MFPVTSTVAQSLGPLGSPAGVLGVLVVLAVIVLIGRFLLAMAWRLILVAIAVVGALYLLGLVGISVGVF